MTAETRAEIRRLIDARRRELVFKQGRASDDCDYCGKELPPSNNPFRRFCSRKCNEQMNKPGVLA